MTEQPRRRYRIRFRKALAGSVFVAATAASLTVITAAPAPAAPPATATATAADYGVMPGIGVTSVPEDALPAVTPSDVERLAGVRADLDRAVLLRLVTPEQADAFYAQIGRRVAAGL